MRPVYPCSFIGDMRGLRLLSIVAHGTCFAAYGKPMMRIACLHTASVHQQTFTALFAARVPQAQVIHVVRDDLLEVAQTHGLDDITDAMLAALGGLTTADAVLCTCSTLGPLVDLAGQDKYVRIDRPMMMEAAKHGRRPLLAICLESTRAASLDLLQECGGPAMKPTVHLCDEAWPFFVQGDQDGFADAIATSVAAIAEGHDCIVLGQASMRVAAPQLARLGLPVLTSPELAVARTIQIAQL